MPPASPSGEPARSYGSGRHSFFDPRARPRNLGPPAISGPLLHKRFVTAGFFVLALLAAYKVAGDIIADDLSGLAYIGMFFIGGAGVIAILQDWRRGLYFFLAWLLLEDFVRKFLGNNMAIFFAKG